MKIKGLENPRGDLIKGANVIEDGAKKALACFGRELVEIEGKTIRVAEIRTKTELTAACVFIERETGLNKLTRKRLAMGGEYGGYTITQLL